MKYLIIFFFATFCIFNNVHAQGYGSQNFQIKLDSANSFVTSNTIVAVFHASWQLGSGFGPIFAPAYRSDNMYPEWVDDAWPIYMYGTDSTETFGVEIYDISITDSVQFQIMIDITNTNVNPWASDTTFIYAETYALYLSSVTSLDEDVDEQIFAFNGNIIFPNPATDYVTVQDDQNATATITNMLGQVVRTVPTNQPVDISDFKKGMYIINRNQKLLIE